MTGNDHRRRMNPLAHLINVAGRAGLAAVFAFVGLVSMLALQPITGAPLLPLQSASARACLPPLALVNSSFENPFLPDTYLPFGGVTGDGWTSYGNAGLATYGIPEAQVPGWSTTESVGGIQLFRPTGGFIPAHSGSQYAETNHQEAAKLFQSVDTTAYQGVTLTWSFAHHAIAEGAPEQVRLEIGPTGGAPNFTFSSTVVSTDGWVVRSGTYTVPIGQTSTEFGWQSVLSPTPTAGNLLDTIQFGSECSTDLAAEKTTTFTVFAPGQPISYTITITNDGIAAGQFDAVGATLTDNVPADIENVEWICSASAGSSCGNAFGIGNSINETYDILEGGTVTYTVTGTVSDTATITELANTAVVALPATSAGQPFTDSDTANNTSTVTLPRGEPGIEIDKIADFVGPLQVGTVIFYRFVVTNTGEIPLENVIVTDPMANLSAITPASVSSLAPGASVTFTANYTLTQADVDAGTLSNTASVTTDPIGPIPPPTDEDTEIVPGDPNPQLTLVKSSDLLPGAAVAAGDTITYTFQVTNTGNVTIENVTVADPLPGLSAITPASVATLAPGASTVFTATYQVTQADIDAGQIVNEATPGGEVPDTCITCPPVDPVPGEVITDLTQDPDLSIEKSADPVGGVLAGDTITYTFEVTNTGNVTIENATVSDALPGLAWVTGPNVGTLTPGQSATATATYVVTQADIDAGTVHNSASVTGEVPDGCDCTAPTDEDETDVPTAGTPGLDLAKTSNVQVGETVGVGDTITYTYTLTNTGNVPITDATITDTMPGLSWVTGPNLGTIAVGGSATGSATYLVTQADVDTGFVHNAATADGDCGQGCDVPEDEDEVDVPTDPADPSIDVAKSSNPAGGVELGDVITYTFTATNTGNVTLTGVTVTDPLPGLSAITPAAVATLAPGETATFTAAYTVDSNDVARGFVHNSATITSEPPLSCAQCPPVTDTDEHDVPTSGNPGVVIDKESDADGAVTLGQTITYTFEVFNTGDVNLENIVVTDTMPGLSTISCPQTTLLAGGSMECTATYTVTQADIDNGRIDNSATISADPVDGGDPVTDGDDETTPTEPQIPGIELEKSADTAGPVAAGDVITYTFTVTNTGNISLSNVTVTDNLGGLSWVTGPNLGDLAPGENATGSATYTVTQADVDAGQVHNSATVTGEVPDSCVGCPDPSDPDEVIVETEDPAPAIDLTKVADTQGPAALGDTITYTFTAANTGNITLNNVTIEDTLPGLTWVTGPNLGTLTPGQSATGTATYVVTEADIIAGGVLNTATIGVEFPPTCTDCPPIDPPAPEVEIPAEEPNPELSIDKVADTAGPVGTGDTITYTFTVTNTGNVTLSGITLADALPGLTWVTGPALGDFAPGQSGTGTATYVVTEADVLAGSVANAATVTGETPDDCTACPPIDPPTDEVEVPTEDPNPALSLDKVTDTAGPVNVGDAITYTFTVTNTGNVTLDNVTIADPLPGLSWVTGPNVGTLTPGQSSTGTATYTVTEADVIAGSMANAATATGQTPDDCIECPPVDPPADEVEVPTENPNPELSLDKAADTAGPVVAGDVITYTFTVTNTGNVTISNVTLSDVLTGLAWVTAPALGDLAPGASATGTATYTVTQADVLAGSVANAATATGETPDDCTTCPPVDPPTDEVEVTTENPNPALSIDKTADTAGPVNVGDTITYTFTVTNTGNVLITNVTLSDALPGLTWITGPALGDLAAGQSATGTATYVVTQADVDAGVVSNAATVTGEPDPNCTDCPPIDPPTDVIEIPTDDDSGIVLEKSSDTDGPVSEGDVITYTFTVTNTGTVTLTNITVDDPKIGAVFCANELAPRATVTCSAPYTVTAADIAAGQVYNSATVTGATPDGGSISDGDDDTVTTENPCAPVEAPLSGEVLNLSLRALQVDPSTPQIEPTIELPTEEPTGTATLEPTETVTETATAEPTETVTETATSEPTETATDEGTETVTTADESTPQAGTPTAEAGCPSPTPQPTPTPKPSNPGNPGGGAGGGGGSIPPVTDLPSTGNGIAATNNDFRSELIFGVSALVALLIGSTALRRHSARTRADQ